MWSWYHSSKLSRNFSLGYVSETYVEISDFDVISVNEREDSLFRLDIFIYTRIFVLSFYIKTWLNFITEEKNDTIGLFEIIFESSGNFIYYLKSE